MLTAEQIELRQRGLGGSEQGTIAGVSQYMMAIELYYRKRGEWEEPERDPFFADMGHAAEAPLAAWYERETGAKLYQQRKTRFPKDPDLKFLLMHSDRLIRGKPRAGVEFKMRASFQGWGHNLTDDIPPDVMLQCQQYMLISRADWWDVVVLLAGVERRRYRIGADRTIQDDLIARSADFWAGIQLGNPPPLDYEHATATKFLTDVYYGANGKSIELPPDLTAWMQVYQDAGKRLRDLESTREAAKARILETMGPAARAFSADGLKQATRKFVQPADPNRDQYLQFRITDKRR